METGQPTTVQEESNRASRTQMLQGIAKWNKNFNKENELRIQPDNSQEIMQYIKDDPSGNKPSIYPDGIFVPVKRRDELKLNETSCPCGTAVKFQITINKKNRLVVTELEIVDEN